MLTLGFSRIVPHDAVDSLRVLARVEVEEEQVMIYRAAILSWGARDAAHSNLALTVVVLANHREIDLLLNAIAFEYLLPTYSRALQDCR